MQLTHTQRIGSAVALATAIAIPAEGLFLRWYSDAGPGVATVCYGHTANVDKSKTYTVAECKALLDADMNQAVSIVEACWPRQLPVKMIAALGDLVFNVGPTPVCNVEKSTLARKLRDRDYIGACEELPKWNKTRLAGVLVELPGLTKRRERERILCLEGANEY